MNFVLRSNIMKCRYEIERKKEKHFMMILPKSHSARFPFGHSSYTTKNSSSFSQQPSKATRFGCLMHERLLTSLRKVCTCLSLKMCLTATGFLFDSIPLYTFPDITVELNINFHTSDKVSFGINMNFINMNRHLFMLT